MNGGRSYFGRLRTTAMLLGMALALGLFPANPLRAQIKTDPGSECESESNLNYRIEYCTVYIDSGLLGDDLIFALLSRGNAYNDGGEQDLAIKDYSEALRIDPKNPDAFHNRGIAYSNKRDFDHAIADFDQAIRFNRKFISALTNRGNAYSAKGNFDLALKDYDEVIRLSPKGPKAADGFVNRGNLYNSKGNYDRALQDYDQALRLDPNDAGALYNRGLAFDGKGNYARAIEDFNQAIRRNPSDQNAVKARALDQFFVGQYSQAAAGFSRAAHIEPEDVYIRLWLYVAGTRGGVNGRDALDAAAPKLDLTYWPGPVVELFQGRMEPAIFLQTAGDPGSKERQAPVCEAHFFLAEYKLIHGKDANEARGDLQSAVQLCPDGSVSAKAAKAEVARLGSAK